MHLPRFAARGLLSFFSIFRLILHFHGFSLKQFRWLPIRKDAIVHFAVSNTILPSTFHNVILYFSVI